MKTYPMKCAIRGESGGVTRVDVYDDIGEDPWFGGGISAAAFMDKLAGVRGPLDVHISSAGGMVDQGLAIYNALAAYNGPVTTYNDGLAASVASVIMQAGRRRVMSPVSALMIHDAWGDPGPGNAADMEAMRDALSKNSDIIARAYADRAGGTVPQWRERMQATTWYDADEALAAGLIDEIAGGSKPAAPVDLDAVAASAPVRIMARLRAMPQAAAVPHGPMTGTHSHPHPAYGGQGADATHDHQHAHGADGTPDAHHGHGHDTAPEDRLHAEAGKPYQPQPYHRDPDENTECPQCHLFNDTDANYCDQCGCKLIGREDVRVLPAAGPAGSGGRGVRNAGGDEQLGDGWVRGADGQIRFDPDGDGDDDSTPEGDTDHDYFAPDGTPVKPIPPCPVSRDALTEDRVRAIIREEVIRAAAAKVDDSPWDASKAWHNGAQADNPEAFYRGICAGHHTSGDPATQAYWALPYRYTPDSPPNAGGVRSAWGVLNGAMGGVQDLADRDAVETKVKSLMKQVNPDWSPDDKPDDKSDTSIFAADAAGRYRAALKGARA